LLSIPGDALAAEFLAVRLDTLADEPAAELELDQAGQNVRPAQPGIVTAIAANRASSNLRRWDTHNPP
jgi:hypothetical protein